MSDPNEMPTYQVYSVLLAIFDYPHFTLHNAELLLRHYADANGAVTLPELTLENIELWHKQFRDESLPDDPGADRVRIIVEHCMKDLGPNIQTAQIHRLCQKWIERTGLQDEIHLDPL